MSFFKRWGGGQGKKSTKDKSDASAPSSLTASSQSHYHSSAPSTVAAAVHSHDPRQSQMKAQSTAGVSPKHDEDSERSMAAADDEENINLPSSLGRRKERNLSISRSGRHKYKNKQRSSVLRDEVYNDIPTPPTSPTSPAPSTTSPPTQSTSHGNASPGNHASSTASQSDFGSMGRAGACREIDTSSRRISTDNRVARQPTAV